MKKMSQRIYFVCLVVLLISSLCIVFHSFFIGNTYGENLSPLLILLISILEIAVLAKVRQKIKTSKIERCANIIAILGSVISFILLLFAGFHFFGQSTLDMADLEAEAGNLVNSDTVADTEYFSVYNNNFFYLTLLALVFRFANFIHVDPLRLCLALSALAVSLSFYLCYLSAKKMSNAENGLFVLFALITNPIFYIYLNHFYTDIAIIPIACGTLLLMTNIIKQQESSKRTFLYYFLLGILFVFGMKIRPTVIVIFAAFAFYYLFKMFKKRHLLGLPFVLVGCLLAFGATNLVTSQFKLDYSRDKAFPATHWLMMGANQKSEGAWNAEDYNITKNEPSYEKKVRKNLSEIKKRILSMSPAELARHASQKLKRVWGHGNHAYTVYTKIVHTLYPVTDWINGERKTALFYVLQANNTVLWILIVSLTVVELSKLKRKISIWILSILGAIIFYLFWETAPKYSLSFIPIIATLAFTRFSAIEKAVKSLSIKLTSRQLSWNSVASLAKKTCLIVSVLLFVFNAHHLTVEEDFRSTKVVSTVTGSPISSLNLADSNITQTFDAKMPFNYIALRPATDCSKKCPSAKVSLQNSAGNKVIEGEIKLTGTKRGELATLQFEESVPAGDDYILAVSSDSPIAIITTHKNNLDLYHSGTLTLNEEKSNDDISMEIGYRSKQAIVSKAFYVIACLAILMLELWAFGYLPSIAKHLRFTTRAKK